MTGEIPSGVGICALRTQTFLESEGLVGAGRFELPTPCAQGERNRFQAVYRFLGIPNGYNNPGNLLSLKEQGHRMERIEFGRSFVTGKAKAMERRSMISFGISSRRFGRGGAI